MIRSIFRPRRFLLPAVIPGLFWSLLVMPGCDSGTTVCSPDVPAARLSGRVRTGNGVEDLVLVARPVDLEEGESGSYPTVPDEDGYYAIDVPPGRYILELDGYGRGGMDLFYASNGPVFGDSPADTLAVEDGRIYDDLAFDLGSLTVDVALPDSLLDGENAKIVLHRESADGNAWDSRFRWQVSSSLAGGMASITAIGIPEGRYQVELVMGYRDYACSCPWDGEHVWLPDADGPDQAGWYEIIAGTNVHHTFSSPDRAARLTGVVGGAWLELGYDEEPLLSLIGTDSTEIVGKRPVAADGSFDLFLYQVQPVKVLIFQQGLAQYIGGPDFASATVYTPVPGQSITGILANPCAVTLDTSQPLGTGYGTGDFQIFTSDGQTLLGTIDGSNHFKSLYILPNFWPGDFLLRAVPQPMEWGSVSWAPQWYPGVADMADAEPVTLTQPGEILSLTMDVLVGGSIAGSITDVPNPKAWWYTLISPSEDNTIWGRNYIFGPETAYLLTGLLDGDWKVGVTSISAPGDTIWYPGTTDWTEATVITITDGADVTGIDIPVE